MVAQEGEEERRGALRSATACWEGAALGAREGRAQAQLQQLALEAQEEERRERGTLGAQQQGAQQQGAQQLLPSLACPQPLAQTAPPPASRQLPGLLQLLGQQWLLLEPAAPLASD